MRYVLALLALAALVPASQAAAAVRVVAVQYHPRGGTSQAALNREWIELRNTGPTTVLRGWTIRDAHGNVYRFGPYSFARASQLRIHTGHGRNTVHHRYWGLSHQAWHDHGDTVTLRDATGALVYRFHYRGGGTIAWCRDSDDWHHGGDWGHAGGEQGHEDGSHHMMRTRR